MTFHFNTEKESAVAHRKKDAEWYDDFYKIRQVGLSPWYRFLLPALGEALKQNPDSKLIELGCGQAQILRVLAGNNLLPQENITGLDQSKTAVEFCAGLLPRAKFLTGDIYDLSNLPSEGFDIGLFMETIEHLEDPRLPLTNMRRILRPGGLLYMSFPNYLHAPWLLVRILAEKLNRPNWIVLQPVDKIYTVFEVIRLFENAGFEFLKGIGSNYGPPVLYPLETESITRLLNSLWLWRLSFHPILVFRKRET